MLLSGIKSVQGLEYYTVCVNVGFVPVKVVFCEGNKYGISLNSLHDFLSLLSMVLANLLMCFLYLISGSSIRNCFFLFVMTYLCSPYLVLNVLPVYSVILTGSPSMPFGK
jgi:hypothetical protein